MNIKHLLAVSALVIGMVATVPSSFAVTYTPSQFTALLKLKIGKKKGDAAAAAISVAFKAVLIDKKNKKNVITYTTAVVAALKKAKVPTSVFGKSLARQVSALTKGYFTGLKFTLTDPKFNTSLKKLLGSIPAAAQTQTTTALLFAALRQNAPGVSGGSLVDYFNQTIKPAGLPPAVSP